MFISKTAILVIGTLAAVATTGLHICVAAVDQHRFGAGATAQFPQKVPGLVNHRLTYAPADFL